MSPQAQPIFPNYLQEKRFIPVWPWHLFRLGSLSVCAGLIWLCWHDPHLALLLFWGLAVPLLPLVFWLLPGLWRNLCPLATANQVPRLFRISFQFNLAEGFKRYTGVIGILLLFIAVPLRLLLLNSDASALSMLILIALVSALTGGILFKGKSGWCGSICPLLPVQRLYGQSPLNVIPNSHCQPCVGCTRNCYDFNPRVAYLADLYDADPVYGGDRKFFAGAMPGLILAYYTLPDVNQLLWWKLYLQFGLYCLVGVGSFYVLETFLKISSHKITALFAMLSINVFYWFSAKVIINTLTELTPYYYPEWLVWSVRIAVLLLSIRWFMRTIEKEPLFLSQAFSALPTRLSSNAPIKQHIARQSDNPVVTIEPTGAQLVARPQMSLLELLESNGESINSGCRMGACGADPVAIVKGGDKLSSCGADEQSTLERLGFYNEVRMACCAKIEGDISIDLNPQVTAGNSDIEADFNIDTDIKKLVIIGNGIAGVTAADYVRRYNKDCEIDVIGQEKYPLYNRMAISKLIYSRGGLQGLLLLPEDWYEKRDIHCWLNTRVRSINTDNKTVNLATGETLNFDKLIITTGSQAFVPKINNIELTGCFVLRSADDAMSIRDYIQQYDCRSAVVAGGGLLGLEAAYALQQMNMKVTILERSAHLLHRQLDAQSAAILDEYLQALGMNIRYSEQLTGVESNVNDRMSVADEQIRVSRAVLKNSATIKTDIVLIAAGIAPNIKLVSKTGLKTDRGVLVNEQLYTSDKNILAAGDIAQLDNSAGLISGLWTVAVEQAQIAAKNALGATQKFSQQAVPTALKVVGVELTSVGQFNGDENDTEIIFSENQKYRKLIVRNNRIIGAILLGYPEYAQCINQAILTQQDISAQLQALNSGDWKSLREDICS
jgi:NADPH-dependent 2,4-dienoyl-CoA reductase/sulfur reductase-like enzyme/ferredoxin